MKNVERYVYEKLSEIKYKNKMKEKYIKYQDFNKLS